MSTKEVSPRWAFVTALVVIVLLQLVLAYGNDIASCQRTEGTRRASATRNVTAVGFQRALANKVERRAQEETAAAALLTGDHTFGARVVKAFLTQRASEDNLDSVDYRNYADTLSRQIAPVIDCGQIPPST